MHIEVQVALNFVISYLYNKLPRRRVNIFGEELEKALKDKFRGHWYPERPFKGSAFRCLKTGDPVDAVFETAARESGVPIQDVLENLPQDLAVWVDPGEVSYRIGEKGNIKVLYSESAEPPEEASAADKEVIKTFNPEAQCFRPIEAATSSLGAPPAPAPLQQQPFKQQPPASPSPVAPPFIPRSTAPLTFTTATFAQTKFGSTKLKTNSKRANRMSPTEFSNYIKQRAMQQQQQQQQQQGLHGGSPGRSLSPHHHSADYLYQQPQPDIYPKFPYLDPSQYYAAVAAAAAGGVPSNGGAGAAAEKHVDSNFSLGGSYSPGQYQHLLVAN
ncbi:hypothetical protein AAG570_000611 [Ranatra chinensis]|uniref:Anti-proliferative protein domain-containing protein n=1 Tax=Ranatra chinensis TaxID=642074 RepID=A0ABD0YXJ2_9HEMI